jgi:hypothetical protein
MRVEYTLDYFGAAGSGILSNLLNQSSNQRARRVAFNNFERIAKSAGSIPRGARVLEEGLVVNKGGVIKIFMTYHSDELVQA